MTLTKYLRDSWNTLQSDTLRWREHVMQWRRDPAVLRLEHPSRLERARALGFRAKEGVFMVRVRVSAGGHTRPDFDGGRHSKRMRNILALRKNYQAIAEQRAVSGYTNCEVVNSYFLAKDSKHHWFEVILADRAHPAILADHRFGVLSRGRAYRGLTAAGRKHRGLRWKGKGVEKARPSRRAHSRLL
ncbi:50S ribosomal protein L15e [Candidatus Woesearchaeota archaeon]|nr:50S ribosomal protein L15e [Candidatus Woesearchaeota archaeon]